MESARAHAGSFVGNPFSTFVSNGTQQCEICVTSAIYIDDEAAPSLAFIRSKAGLPKLINSDVLFGRNPLKDFALIGESAIDDVPIAAYSNELSEDDDQILQHLYISTESGLPVRFSHYEPGESEWVETKRINYTDWEFDAVLPDDLFDPTPPPGMNPKTTA